MSEVDDFLKKISSKTKKQTTNTNLDDILSKFRTFSVNSSIEINEEILNVSQQSEKLDQQTTNLNPQTNLTRTDIDEILNKTKTNSVLGNSNNYLSNDLPDFQEKEKEKGNLVGLQIKKKPNFSIDSLLGLSTNKTIEEEEQEEQNLMSSNQIETQQQSTKNESQIYNRSIDDILHQINHKKKSNQIDELLNRAKNSKSSENQNYQQQENQTSSYKSDIERIFEKKESQSNFNNNNEDENNLKENQGNSYNQNNSYTSIDDLLFRSKSVNVQSTQYSNNLKKTIQNRDQIQTNENDYIQKNNSKDNEDENNLNGSQNNSYNQDDSYTSIDDLLSRSKNVNVQSTRYPNNLKKTIHNRDQIQTNKKKNYYNNNEDNENENENNLNRNQNNNYIENNSYTSIDDLLSRSKNVNVQSTQYSNNLNETIENSNNLLNSNIPEQINYQKSINTQNEFSSELDQFINQISDNSSNNLLIDNLINQNNRFDSQNESNLKQNLQTINEQEELESYQYQNKEQQQESEQLEFQEKEEENNKMNQKTYSNNNSIYSNDIETLLSRAKSSKKINEKNFSTKEKEKQETINNTLNIQQEREKVQEQETKISNDYKSKYSNKIESLFQKNKKKRRLRKINPKMQNYRNSSFDEIDRLVSLAKLTNLNKLNENLEKDFIEDTGNNVVVIEKTNSNLKQTNNVYSFENENENENENANKNESGNGNEDNIENKFTEELHQSIKRNDQETEKEREREKEKEIKQLMNIYKNKQNEYLQLKNKLDDLDKEDEEFENNKKNNKSIEINIENNNTKKSKALSILINLNDQLCKSHDQYQTNVSYLIDHFDLKLKNNSMEVVNKLQEIFENNKNNKTRKLNQPFKSRKLLYKILNNYLRSLNLPYFREKILDKINEMINKDINIFEENTILIIKNKLIRLLKNTVLVDKEEENIFNTLETIFNLFYFSTVFRKKLTRYLVNYLKMNNIINQFPKIHNKLKNINNRQKQGENLPVEDDDDDDEDENDNNRYFINNLIENIFLEFDEYLYGYPEEAIISNFLTRLFTNLNLDKPEILANDITINSFKMTANIFFKELLKQLIDKQNLKEIELISKKILFEHGQVYSELIESCQATNLKKYLKKNDIYFFIALLEYTRNRSDLKDLIYKLSNNLFPLFNSLGIADELIQIGFTLSISTSNSMQEIFQGDGLLIKLLINYFKVEGKDYLKKIFKDLMDEILLNNISFLMTSNFEANEEKRINNFKNLKYYLNSFGNKIYSSQNILPIGIKNIFHTIHKLFTHKYTQEWIPVVSNIFFSYFIGLALNSPFQYGLVDKPFTDWQVNQNFSILYEAITHMTQNVLYDNSNLLLYQLNDIMANVNRKRNMFLRIIVQQQNIQPHSDLEKNFFSDLPNQEELVSQLIKKISIHFSKFLKRPIDISNGEMAILNLINQYNELSNRFSSIQNLNNQLSKLHNKYPSIFALEKN
ncbi:ras gtpase-activating protein [Anaeramoeba flamelloides]|uniref:Ras gtpase-activating protein n=1 Tax=Anaeramoeba flamelloides TaxID=1746091 RepID=A0ABQ8Y2F4_9EUKA|nr:ras gtpase-activating protein [Anaeramoeba flamelloides]